MVSCFCVLVFVGGLPGRLSKCSLAWQRGAKLQYTAAAFVDAQEHVVYWDETLKQVRGEIMLGRPWLGFLMDMQCGDPREAEEACMADGLTPSEISFLPQEERYENPFYRHLLYKTMGCMVV